MTAAAPARDSQHFIQSFEALAAHLSASGLDAAQATGQAYARVYQAVIGQATILAFINTFWVPCMGAAIMFLLSFAVKRITLVPAEKSQLEKYRCSLKECGPCSLKTVKSTRSRAGVQGRDS